MFGRDSDEEEDDSSEDEYAEAGENTPPLGISTTKSTVETNNSDENSDYDMGILDGDANGAKDTSNKVQNTATEHKKVGKKKKKTKKADAETPQQSNLQRKEGSAKKRKGIVDPEGLKLKKKKKLKVTG